MQLFEPVYIVYYLPQILPYLWVTFATVAVAVCFGSLLGLAIAAAKLGHNKFAKGLADGYTTILRCTPPVVLLFIVYYCVPQVLLELFGVDINDIYKGIFVFTTLALLFAANVSETFRTAYLSIDKGQREAAVAMGLSEFQAFRRILLPQCFVVALPNLGNALITLIKEGTLAYTIGYIDFMGKTSLVITDNFGARSREIYLGIALVYWLLAILIERGFLGLERWFGRSRAGLSGKAAGKA